jgi:hypothetical protein
VVAVILLATVHRLPAPISEVETPTPSPKTPAKAHLNRANESGSNRKKIASSSRAGSPSIAVRGFVGNWEGKVDVSCSEPTCFICPINGIWPSFWMVVSNDARKLRITWKTDEGINGPFDLSSSQAGSTLGSTFSARGNDGSEWIYSIHLEIVSSNSAALKIHYTHQGWTCDGQGILTKR